MKTDTAGIRFPPPLVFLGFVLLGPLVERIVEIPALALPWPVGAVVLTAGAVLIAMSSAIFRRRGENPTPWSPTSQVITAGPYRWSRNPMYLGMAIVAVGLAMLMHSWSALIFAGVATAIVNIAVIRREEAYLRATFGQPYIDYCQRVRRWI